MGGKTIKVWLIPVIPVAMVIALFALQGTFLRVGSEVMGQMQGHRAAANIADSIRLLYDYSGKRCGDLKYTFLEFGAKGCISCRKMEAVMEEVRHDWRGQVKVRFMNVAEKETQEWAKFFGIVVIPTQVVLDRTGREVFRHTGFIPAEQLSRVFK